MLAVYNGHPLLKYTNEGVDLEMLSDFPLVFFERDVGTALYDEIISLLANVGVVPTISQEAGEAMTILGLVAAGLGVSIVTESFIRMKLDGVQYLPLANNPAYSEVWLVKHKNRNNNPAAKRLTNLLISNIV
ncbi:LysR substrate binding domain-containing protein [Xenorhabdus japonica]|uniref:LysR substrate binding domain-containing protein n=1 Tax=Xenorhabdus japonica TaxID=53341 RepID=A0A1I5DG01_9GAMM|nr:LysR substrate binding domain-containing protein [Xenorhabdus japonica]